MHLLVSLEQLSIVLLNKEIRAYFVNLSIAIVDVLAFVDAWVL